MLTQAPRILKPWHPSQGIWGAYTSACSEWEAPRRKGTPFIPALGPLAQKEGVGCHGLSQNWAECFTCTQLLSSVALGKLYMPCASVFSSVNGDNNNTHLMELL